MRSKLIALCCLLLLGLCGCTNSYVESPVDAGMEQLDKYSKELEQGLGELDKIMQESAQAWNNAG